MMRWLAEVEPQLETVDTFNAESNDHMVAVNERLGYRVMGRELPVPGLHLKPAAARAERCST